MVLSVKILLGHLITCKHATRLLSETQEHPLSRGKRLLLRLHLACCDACQRFERQLRFLREAMRKYRE